MRRGSLLLGNRPNVLLLIFAMATFAVYLAFSLYYVTHSENLSAHWTLRQRGDEFLRAFPGWDTASEGDSALYNREAIGILRTGIPRARSGAVYLYAPLYAYFLAACYWIGGVQQMSVSVPQALLAGATCWFLGLTARRVAPANSRVAMLIAAALLLVNLRLAINTSYISPTLLLLFWFSIALFLATRPLTAANSFGLGLVVALSVQTQASFFLVGMAFVAWLALRSSQERSLRPVLGCVLILLSAGVRLAETKINAAASEARGSESMILYEANNPYYESMTLTSLWERRPSNPWTEWQASETEQRRYDDYLDRAQRERQNPGILWIRENLGQYAKLCFVRLRTELGPYTGQMSPRNRAIAAGLWIFIFPAGAYGLWKSWKQPVTVLALLICVVVVGFDTLVIVEWYLRYRLPVEIILTIYAGIAYAGLRTSTGLES
jgi:hypothetical protein